MPGQKRLVQDGGMTEEEGCNGAVLFDPGQFYCTCREAALHLSRDTSAALGLTTTSPPPEPSLPSGQAWELQAQQETVRHAEVAASPAVLMQRLSSRTDSFVENSQLC
ncbi:hypothetical protein WMY93_006103 [Mugilogobius chulae]|uniref:Uncharacterized protein n=1 Tax=Mugilogobius chulae TaxID=88201 RepID=A0AAW0PIR5_9GOBI